MELTELKHQIQTNDIRNFYIFAGEETGIMKIYIKQISKKSNKPIEYVDTVQSAFERSSRSGLVSKSKIIVVQDDKAFLRSENLWSRVANSVKRDILILVFSKIDKRSKFFKSNDYVAFNFMPAATLSHYISKVCPMNAENSTQLAEICECSYNRCMQECDKINSYVGYRESVLDPVTADMAFRLLLNNGTIYRPIGDITFKVVDAIMNRNNVKEIEQRMIQVRTIQEPRLLLISLLYNNFRSLLMYQSLPDKSKAEEVAGLSKFEIYSAKKHENRYSNNEIIRAMQILQSLEFGIKTGTVSEEISLDYFIAQVI